MKNKISLFFLCIVFLYTNLFGQNIADGRKYITIAKEAYNRDNMSPRIRSSLNYAFKKDKYNPEVYFLISVYFYNLDQDIQKAKEALNKFNKRMSELSSNDGGKYKQEYNRLKAYVGLTLVKGTKKNGLSDELYDSIWKVDKRVNEKELCFQCAKNARSFLDNNNLPQAKNEILKLDKICSSADDQLKQAISFLKAKYALLSNNLEKAVKINNDIKSVHKDFQISYTNFEQELKNSVNIEGSKIIQNTEKMFHAGNQQDAQQELNKINRYWLLLQPKIKSDYYFNYARIDYNLGDIDKATEEIKKAENINYKPHEEKITDFMGQLSINNGRINTAPAITEIPSKSNLSNNKNSNIPQFSEISNRVKRDIKRGNTEEALRILNKVGDPAALSNENRITYFFLKTKIFIKENKVIPASENLKKVIEIDNNDKIVKSLKSEYGRLILSAAHNKNLKTDDKILLELEMNIKNNMLLPISLGEAYYILAATYNGNNKQKFDFYKKYSKQYGYNNTKLSALKWNGNKNDLYAGKKNVSSKPSEIPRKMITTAGFPFSMKIKYDKNSQVNIIEKRRLEFDGDVVEFGMLRSKKTNELIPLKTATGYEIDIENLTPKSSRKKKKNLYLGVLATSVIGALIFIR